MTARILADILAIIHLLFILFVILGGLLVFWRRRMAWLHLPAAAWGVGIELWGGTCPLTPLEQQLRESSPAPYRGGFIEHYLLPVIYPDQLTREIQWALGLGVLGLNLAIYGWVWFLRRNRRT